MPWATSQRSGALQGLQVHLKEEEADWDVGSQRAKAGRVGGSHRGIIHSPTVTTVRRGRVITLLGSRRMTLGEGPNDFPKVTATQSCLAPARKRGSSMGPGMSTEPCDGCQSRGSPLVSLEPQHVTPRDSQQGQNMMGVPETAPFRSQPDKLGHGSEAE